ncbi:hypothetical protein D3C79_971190 [compost metagenome]
MIAHEVIEGGVNALRLQLFVEHRPHRLQCRATKAQAMPDGVFSQYLECSRLIAFAVVGNLAAAGQHGHMIARVGIEQGQCDVDG